MSFTLAFALIGWRLVDLGLMAEQHEPSLARSLSSDALETGRADIVDRNGVVLATTMPTASLYANPQHVRDPETAAEQLARSEARRVGKEGDSKCRSAWSPSL